MSYISSRVMRSKARLFIGPFLMSYIIAGHEIESETGMCQKCRECVEILSSVS